ncbi:hypothetical protein Dsin_005557 [Dipteronia sinensis]|uniref:Uncharacterized protein n=1 Tax=Dipteronia sinensis TaxID=43782 RepID=A0AAE0AXK7_9ROSI|nr:hypothetical protein Dsin_005557 [Dipteronia sinensis]
MHPKHLNGKENKKQESLEGCQIEERVQEPVVVANHHNKYVPLKVAGSRIINFQLHLHCTNHQVQSKRIKDMFKGGSIREKMVLRLVDTEVVPTVPIVYELMRVMKDAVKQQRGSKWVLNIIQDRWDKMLNHPLYAASYYLNLKYQYRDNIGDNSDLLKAVHNVYAQLDTKAAGIANFGNEDGRKVLVNEQSLQLEAKCNQDSGAGGWNAGATSWDVRAGGWDAGTTGWNASVAGWDAHTDTEDSSLGDSQTMSGSHVPYYGSYGGCNIFDYPSPQMPYADQQYPPSWVNPNYPIHGSVGRDQATYV